MTHVGIVTDSTCDLPKSLVEEHGIEVAPCILVIEGRQVPDEPGIPRRAFYERLAPLSTPASTAAPSMGEFAACYRHLFDRGCDHILSIHAASSLTALVGTALQAAQDFGARVTVVDSGSLSLGLGFQVLAAAEAAEDGLEASRRALASARQRLQLLAALDTLQYARRSGRLPGALSALGGMLNIKPLISVSDGKLRRVAAVRTTKQATARLASFVLSAGRLERLAILHTGAESRARELLDQLMRQASQALPREILLVNITPVIGVHIGPNALGFAAVKA